MTESELVERLEKLERDNRRLKRFGAAAMVLVAALGLVAATRPVPSVLKAHELEILDNAGRVRIRLGVGPRKEGADVTLFDAAGKRREDLGADDAGAAWIHFLDSQGHAAMLLVHIPARLSTFLGLGSEGQSEITLARPATKAGPPSPGIDIAVRGASEPSVALFGPQGFRMVLGSAQTRTVTTGATQQTSAASIVMFGNDKKHHVIWKAP